MGSSGTGRLSDYSDFVRGINVSPAKGNEGPDDPVDKCILAFTTELEDIETSERYVKTKTLPSEGDHIRIGINTRIVAIDDNDMVVGNLPTKYNYLFDCINGGHNYEGNVEDAIPGLVPLVIVAVTPDHI